MTVAEQERRLNLEARARLDHIAEQYARFAYRTRIILATLAVAQLGLGLLSVYLLGENSDRSEENAALIERIQHERDYAVRFNCSDVNRRNGATKNELERLSAAAPGRESRRQTERRIEATKLLIDRLLPVRDCGKLADRLVNHG